MDNYIEEMNKVIKSLQNKSKFSTRRIVDLLILDLQFNDGIITQDIEDNLKVIEELKRGSND